MADVKKALETQIRNIENSTGKTLGELTAYVKRSGLAKHGEIVSMLKKDLGLGHGNANAIAHLSREDAEEPAAPDDPLEALYVGPKQALRPIHDALLEHLKSFGEFETAPKKKYISYRRKRQFAMIGPPTNSRVEVGLNIKVLPESPRLEQLPGGQMCNYRVKLTDSAQVDDELVSWINAAYDAAG